MKRVILILMTLAVLFGIIACKQNRSEEEIVEGMEDDHHHDHRVIDAANVKDRPMSDFNGSWISGIPLINDGSLDSYIRHTAEGNEVPPENQKAALRRV
jgi:Zn/Cd-binding protein ZinT